MVPQRVIQRVGEGAVEAFLHQQAHQPGVDGAALADQAEGRAVPAGFRVKERGGARGQQGFVPQPSDGQPQPVGVAELRRFGLEPAFDEFPDAVADAGAQVHRGRSRQDAGMQEGVGRRRVQEQERLARLPLRAVHDAQRRNGGAGGGDGGQRDDRQPGIVGGRLGGVQRAAPAHAQEDASPYAPRGVSQRTGFHVRAFPRKNRDGQCDALSSNRCPQGLQPGGKRPPPPDEQGPVPEGEQRLRDAGKGVPAHGEGRMSG